MTLQKFTLNVLQDIIRKFPKERRDKCKLNSVTGPSDKWFRDFEQRHPELKWAVPQMLESNRARQSTRYIVDDFFNKYGKKISFTFKYVV